MIETAECTLYFVISADILSLTFPWPLSSWGLSFQMIRCCESISRVNRCLGNTWMVTALRGRHSGPGTCSLLLFLLKYRNVHVFTNPQLEESEHNPEVQYYNIRKPIHEVIQQQWLVSRMLELCINGTIQYVIFSFSPHPFFLLNIIFVRVIHIVVNSCRTFILSIA